MWGLAGVCVAPESSRGQHLLWTSGQGLMTAMHLGKCYRNLPPVPGKPWPCESADPGPGAQPDEAVTGEEAGMRATPPNGRAQGENACPLCFLPSHRYPWGPFWVFWWGHLPGDAVPPRTGPAHSRTATTT